MKRTRRLSLAVFTTLALMAALCLFPKFLVQKAKGEAQSVEQAEKRDEAPDPALRPADRAGMGETPRQTSVEKDRGQKTAKTTALPDGP